MRCTAPLTVGLLLFLCPAVVADEPTLENRLAPLAKAHKGKVAIAVKHLDTGHGWTLTGDEAMPTASLTTMHSETVPFVAPAAPPPTTTTTTAGSSAGASTTTTTAPGSGGGSGTTASTSATTSTTAPASTTTAPTDNAGG